MKLYSLRNWLGFIALSAALCLAGSSAVHANGATSSKGRPAAEQTFLIHLGHATDDIHAADMALHMGTNLLAHHARVTLFLDREGVRLADSRLPIETLTWGENNLGKDYEAFVKAGGTVLVCPGCAANQGLTAQLLRSGAVMGTHDSVAAELLAADKVIDF